MIGFEKFKNQTLEKAYKGKTFKITIRDGFATLKAKGKKFRSPSALAEAITGHRTSGLYFLGLVDYRKEDRESLDKALRPSAKKAVAVGASE